MKTLLQNLLLREAVDLTSVTLLKKELLLGCVPANFRTYVL